MIPTPLWKLYTKLFGITKPYLDPYLTGDGNGFFFGTRNKKEFFLSLLASYQSDVAVTLEADEIRNRIDRGETDHTFRFVFPLGKEYWRRPVSASPEYFVKSAEHWIDTNPPFSKAWLDPEETAIRAINWIAGYHLFSDHSSVTKQFIERFLRVLYLHGSLCSRYLRKNRTNETEKLIVLIAAQLVGTMFYNHRSGKRWHDRSIRQIDDMIVQEEKDRVNDLSIRRLEFYTISYCASKRFNVNRKSGALNKFHTMYKAAAQAENLHEVNRKIFRYNLEEETSMLIGLFPVGAVLFQDTELKKLYSKYSEDALWLSGTEGFEVFRSISS